MSLFSNKDERISDFADLFMYYHGYGVANKYLRNEALMAYLNDGGFFTAPASTKYHGVYEGGLYDHSRAVTKELENITDCMGLKWQREESPFIVGMFHDLCKCDQYRAVYKKPELGETFADWVKHRDVDHYEHNDKLLLKGHGEKSVMILSQFMRLTEEEMLCIRYHMASYVTDDWNQYDLAVRKYPNLLYVHLADMIASKVHDT